MAKEFNPEYMSKFFTEPLNQKDSGLMEVEIDKILLFHTGDGHPFEVEEDEDMQELRQSVEANGILEPLLTRPDKDFAGRYELIAGHRRLYIAKSLGYQTIKILVLDYDDAAATKLMVVTNLNKRSHIKPSTKAKAYKMYMDANKKAAGRPQKNSGQVDPNYRTDEKAAEEFGESASTIKRYLRLNELIPEFLRMVDDVAMKLGTGVQLSYLPEASQTILYTYMDEHGFMPSLEEATEIRQYAADGGTIDEDFLDGFIGKKNSGQVDPNYQTDAEVKPKKVRLNEKFINEYLPVALRKKSVEEKRRYTQEALIRFNQYLEEHPEEQSQWEIES